MTRLLSKLGLIDPARVGKFSAASSASLPIARYAELSCYDEWVAIGRVAQSLGIEKFQVTNHNRAELVTVLEQSPVKTLSPSSWLKLRCMPVRISQAEVVVSMANPLDTDTTAKLQFQLQRSVKICVGQEREIDAFLTSVLTQSDDLNPELIMKASAPLQLKIAQPSVTATRESNIMETDIAAPDVVRVVDAIFMKAIQQGASDLHLCPGGTNLDVRVRVDGITRPLLDIPVEYTAAVVSRIKVLCGMDIAERRLPQDGRLRLKTRIGTKDLRISTVPTTYGEDIVARILSPDATHMDFSSLGMPDSFQTMYRKSLRRSSRVNLVTGPTGSGKTSTLYASVLDVKDGTTRIISIEDPIEYRVDGISQIEVNPKIDMTFAKSLRSVLRQDPDLVMVGEIRDSETALTAMQVAQTGHLVLSSLHTNSAAAAITRLRDLGVPSYVMASSLGCIVAQRLVRKLCPDCSVPASGPELERARRVGVPSAHLRQAVGCVECDEHGFKGRTGVYSFLDIRPEVQDAIRKDLSEAEIEQRARAYGFKTLREAGIELLEQGLTTLSELERALGAFDADEQPAHESELQSQGDSPLPAPKWDPSKKEKDSQSIIRKRRILLAEDDEDIQNILRTILESEMFEVTTAGSGNDALAKILEQGLPELIVSDLLMPKMDGRQLLDRLRSDPRMKSVPVLMLTSLADAANEQELLNRGADDFVSKAAPREVLVARINRLLNKSHSF